MKLIVEGEISATNYKKLVAKLKNLSKKQLWEVLDHYIFHVMTDANVIELLNILDQGALETKQVAASTEDDDFFYGSDPRLRFRPRNINTIPTDDALIASKGQIDLMYDYNCFDCYMEPEIRSEVAKKLIAFATENGLPVANHWIDFSQEE